MTERPGWSKPYVGCVNWSGHPRSPRAAVVWRGMSAHFDTWREAIDYANRLVVRVRRAERAS